MVLRDPESQEPTDAHMLQVLAGHNLINQLYSDGIKERSMSGLGETVRAPLGIALNRFFTRWIAIWSTGWVAKAQK